MVGGVQSGGMRTVPSLGGSKLGCSHWAARVLNWKEATQLQFKQLARSIKLAAAVIKRLTIVLDGALLRLCSYHSAIWSPADEWRVARKRKSANFCPLLLATADELHKHTLSPTLPLQLARTPLYHSLASHLESGLKSLLLLASHLQSSSLNVMALEMALEERRGRVRHHLLHSHWAPRLVPLRHSDVKNQIGPDRMDRQTCSLARVEVKEKPPASRPLSHSGSPDPHAASSETLIWNVFNPARQLQRVNLFLARLSSMPASALRTVLYNNWLLESKISSIHVREREARCSSRG